MAQDSHEELKCEVRKVGYHEDRAKQFKTHLKMDEETYRKTVDGVLLLVDAFEGAMPQTREVLKKSLALNLKPIVVINKIDRPGANPLKVVDQVLELFIELNATDEQLDFPVVYASAKNGIAKMNLDEESDNVNCIFETIINNIEPPKCNLHYRFLRLRKR